MRALINAFKAALAVSWLAVALCGALEASVPGTASLNDTTVPRAAYIIDSKAHMWTVSSGVIYEDGVLAGYSNAVTKLLYAHSTVYQENAAAGWWAWNGQTWTSSGDPTANVGAAGSLSSNSATPFWRSPTYNTDGTLLTDLAGFTIYYGTHPSALTQTIQLANPSATSHVIRNLSAGNYFFAVAAYTKAGTESEHSSKLFKAIP